MLEQMQIFFNCQLAYAVRAIGLIFVGLRNRDLLWHTIYGTTGGNEDNLLNSRQFTFLQKLHGIGNTGAHVIDGIFVDVCAIVVQAVKNRVHSLHGIMHFAVVADVADQIIYARALSRSGWDNDLKS